MTGDDRLRHCDECQLSVYNIAELTRAEAEALIANSEGRICARIYRRPDGTVITRDCPVGLRAIRRRMARSAVAVFAALMALATSVFGQKQGSKDKTLCRQQVIMTHELTQAANGLSELNGTVLDPVGAFIPGAKITITAAATSKSVTTSSDEKGSFRVSGLEAGTYKVIIKTQGFKTLQLTEVKLKGSEKLSLEVTSLVEAASVTVGIIGVEPLIDTTSPGKTIIIRGEMLRRLPLP